MNRICVIGHPVSHSRSPLIHSHWLDHYGISGRYERRDISRDQLGPFLRHLEDEGYGGCNITIPHKEAAAQLLRNVSPVARKAQSVNTVWVRGGELHATSTDGEGFYQSLLQEHPGFDPSEKKVLILGAGGSARAIAAHLSDKPFREIVLANRTLSKAVAVAQELGPQLRAISTDAMDGELSNADLVINTTPQGMSGSGSLTLSLGLLRKPAIVADIVYVPHKTPLLREAQTLGLKILPGLGMLLHQAAPGFELWFGVKPEVTRELYDLVLKDLAGAGS